MKIATWNVNGIRARAAQVCEFIEKEQPDVLCLQELMRDWVHRVHAEGKSLILCGDINIARTERDVHPAERKSVIGQTPEERALFESIIGEHLVDVQRSLDPENERLFTWWAPWRKM